ncbi:MAG: CotH kinase family protein [Myxococcota bacterium]
MMPRLTISTLLCLGLITGCQDDATDPDGDDGGGGTTAGTSEGTADDPGGDSEDASATAGTGGEDADETGTTGEDGVDESGSDGGSTGGAGIDWPAELDHVYPQDYVVDIRLDFADGDWASMINDFIDNFIKDYRPAEFFFGDEETLPEIGARFKGFSSLLFIMDQNLSFDPTLNFPLKLNFDYYGGERFHYQDKISLGNNWSDRSYMRERLTARAYAAMDVPVAVTAFAGVEVDETYLGVYTMVQPIDKRFLKAYYGTADGMDDGNLYKCSRTEGSHCRLQWYGSTREDYVTTDCPEGYDECGLLLKTNEDDPLLNDYSDLIELLDIVNNTSDAEFAAQIETVFEVDSFLRLSAVTIALSSFDSYFGMGNNYYLYHRPDTDRFEMIPWDMNMSYGGFGCGHPGDPDPAVPGANMTQAAVDGSFCGSSSDDYPLAERILAIPAYNEAYQGYLREFAETVLTDAQQQAWIDEFDALIGDRIATDPNYPGDEWTYQQALSADQSGQWFRYNLMDFVQRRRTFILSGT